MFLKLSALLFHCFCCWFFVEKWLFLQVKFDIFLCMVFYCCIFFFLFTWGCPGQLTRTTIISHGPLDILQTQEQVRHRGGDRRAHKGSNPGRGRNKSHDWPQQLDPQVQKQVEFWSVCNMIYIYIYMDNSNSKLIFLHLVSLKEGLIGSWLEQLN